MAEYSKEKLYFVKLPSDFFRGHRMVILESLPSGKEYELIYLKLILESVSHNGYLRFSEDTPYTAEMIAAITGATVNEVNGALIALEKLELIRKTENDSIFIPAVPKMTGVTTEGAQRKQEQLARRNNGGSEVEKVPPDIRYKSLENKSLDTRDQELNRKIEPDRTRYKQPALLGILLDSGYLVEGEIDDGWDSLLDGYVQSRGFVDTKIKLKYFIAVANRKGLSDIANRYRYFEQSMDDAFTRDVTEDDEPF